MNKLEYKSLLFVGNAMTPVKAVKQIIQNKDGGELNKIPSSSCVKSGKGMGLAIGKIAAGKLFSPSFS